MTRLAVMVDVIQALEHWLNSNDIHITEGPKAIGPRRTALFSRDPDGNVLEFNQLILDKI